MAKHQVEWTFSPGKIQIDYTGPKPINGINVASLRFKPVPNGRVCFEIICGILLSALLIGSLVFMTYLASPNITVSLGSLQLPVGDLAIGGAATAALSMTALCLSGYRIRKKVKNEALELAKSKAFEQIEARIAELDRLAQPAPALSWQASGVQPQQQQLGYQPPSLFADQPQPIIVYMQQPAQPQNQDPQSPREFLQQVTRTLREAQPTTYPVRPAPRDATLLTPLLSDSATTTAPSPTT